MKYKADDNSIYVIDPPFHRKDEIKSKLSAVWSDSKFRGKGWKFPRNVFVYRELYKFFPELKDDTAFMRHYEEAAKEIKFWKHVKGSGGLEWDSLRPYQNQDVHFLTARGSALVLNEPRTGKTPTMIAVMKALGTKRNLVVCPSSLVFNWKKEFSIWYPEIKIYAINDKYSSRVSQYVDYMNDTYAGKKCVMIVSKDTWKTDLPKTDVFDGVKPFDVAIIDEAHFLRNYKSAQSKAIFGIQAKYKYALTGTPTVKHAVDIYGLLHFINPEAFSSYWQFAERYFVIEESMWGKNIGKVKTYREEELKSLMTINSVQRKRKEVMQWLPEATHQTIPVQMDKKQTKLYDQMFDTFMATDKEDEVEVDTMNKLSQLLRLRQLCLDPRLLGFDCVGTKTKALLEFAENNTEPFVVMTTFSSYFKLIKSDLEELGKRVGIIDGSVSKQQKMETAEAFQRGTIDILLCNIIAAGTGLTLDRADTILFLDKDFSPANNEQAQDRIVPTTKEKYHPINVISLVCDGTVDSRVNEILDNKEDLTKIINKPELLFNS